MDMKAETILYHRLGRKRERGRADDVSRVLPDPSGAGRRVYHEPDGVLHPAVGANNDKGADEASVLLTPRYYTDAFCQGDSVYLPYHLRETEVAMEKRIACLGQDRYRRVVRDRMGRAT